MCILTTIKHITRTLLNMSLHNVWKRKNNIWVPTISKILFSNTTKERTTTKLPTGYIWKNSMCSTCFLLLKLNLFFFFVFVLYEKIALIFDFWSSESDLGKRTSNVTYKSPFLLLWYRGIPSPLNFLTSFGFVIP